MTKSELIELAKGCGVYADQALPCSPDRYAFHTDQLATYTNAIIDRCADEIKHTVYAQDAECKIRDMKVKE